MDDSTEELEDINVFLGRKSWWLDTESRDGYGEAIEELNNPIWMATVTRLVIERIGSTRPLLGIRDEKFAFTSVTAPDWFEYRYNPVTSGSANRSLATLF